MNKRINVKMVKDEQRTIIVVEGASIEQDEVVFQILQTYYGFNKTPSSEETKHSTLSPEIPSVQGLEPLSKKETDIPTIEEINKMNDFSKVYSQRNKITGGVYQGLTVSQALAKHKEKALVILFEYAKELPMGNEKKEIVNYCKQFMYEMPAQRSLYPSRQDKLQFLYEIGKIVTLAPFLMGYQSLNAFSEYAPDNEVEKVFNAVTQCLQDRATHNNTVIR